MTTMNTVISQVVEGSHLAEQASEQMRVTQQTTSELSASGSRQSPKARRARQKSVMSCAPVLGRLWRAR